MFDTPKGIYNHTVQFVGEMIRDKESNFLVFERGGSIEIIFFI